MSSDFYGLKESRDRVDTTEIRSVKVSSVFRIIVLILLVVGFFRLVVGSYNGIHLVDFLSYLTKAPQIPIDWIKNAFVQDLVGFDLVDWGIFNWMKDLFVHFWNGLTAFFQFSFYIITGLANGALFITWFVGFVFI